MSSVMVVEESNSNVGGLIEEMVDEKLQIKPPSSPAGRFTQVLSVGIGGSALGPQFVAEALAPDVPPLKVH